MADAPKPFTVDQIAAMVNAVNPALAALSPPADPMSETEFVGLLVGGILSVRATKAQSQIANLQAAQREAAAETQARVDDHSATIQTITTQQRSFAALSAQG